MERSKQHPVSLSYYLLLMRLIFYSIYFEESFFFFEKYQKFSEHRTRESLLFHVVFRHLGSLAPH